jgi:hypothetical protein
VLGTAQVQNGVHTVGVQGVGKWYTFTVSEGLAPNAINSLLRVVIYCSALMCAVTR